MGCMAMVSLTLLSIAALCAVTPQPRVALAVRAFAIAALWSCLVVPVLSAGLSCLLLCVARRSPILDGILTIWPSLMNFEHVGVVSPEFLVWRTQRIIDEEVLLLKVHREPPVIDGRIDPGREHDSA